VAIIHMRTRGAVNYSAFDIQAGILCQADMNILVSSKKPKAIVEYNASGHEQ